MTTPLFPDPIISSHCTIDPTTRIEHGVHVEAYSYLGGNASIGAYSRIGVGAHIADGVQIGKAVSVDAGVVFAPAGSASSPGEAACVRDQASVGAGAVIYAGVVIGANAVVRPGSVVTRSVPPTAIVEGNPAMIIGYVNAETPPTRPGSAQLGNAVNGIELLPVKGVSVHTFPVIHDLRGDLTVGEFQKQIPFVPLRYFMVFGVPSREIRGEHAHHLCHQFLICIRGSCAVVADDGHHRVEILLDAPNRGIHLPPMTWGVQYKYSTDALLLVFASHHYEAADYIRDYGQFLSLAREASS